MVACERQLSASSRLLQIKTIKSMVKNLYSTSEFTMYFMSMSKLVAHWLGAEAKKADVPGCEFFFSFCVF